MMKNRLKMRALLVLTLFATMATAQTVNMSRYITLTVRQGEQIKLDFRAAVANTPVKIVSGTSDTVVTVGTSWEYPKNYTAGATTMTIYGDVILFDCMNNGNKLTALDVSKNTALTMLYCENNQLTALDVSKNTALTWLYCENNQLTALDVSKNTALTRLHCGNNQLTTLDVSKNTALRVLWCYGNNFITQVFDDIMCSLPLRTSAANPWFVPLDDATDASASAFMAANSQIAKDKNWLVRYNEGSEEEIPATSGTYVCPATSIDEVTSVALALYPNPVGDYVTIATEEVGKAIAITDLAGRTVMTSTATDNEITLNVSHLPNGTYIVRIGSRVAKIVKN